MTGVWLVSSTGGSLQLQLHSLLPASVQAFINVRDASRKVSLKFPRYDGWVTEMSNDPAKFRDLSAARGIDNLLYSADTYFRCGEGGKVAKACCKRLDVRCLQGTVPLPLSNPDHKE